MMDIVLLLFLLILSVFCGIIITLVIQWYIFNVYIMNQPFIGPQLKPVCEPFSLPKNFQEQVSQGKSAGAINALLQFLFQETRNTKRVRKWLRHRLTLELEELLTRTTTGKLFEKIIIRDLQLGSHLPAIHSIEVKELNFDSSTNLLDDVELCLDLDYAGGFQLSIDATMRLSKTAHVSVKVTELKGLARLKFTRIPYTHWSFSFCDDPMLHLSVESQFQGRSLPQINNIIAHQIRKAVKRKHTLPRYKIRYKPFFEKPEPEVSEAEPWPGKLEVSLFEASRLMDPGPKPIFCKVALDSTAWIEMIHSGGASYLTVDVSILKQDAQNHSSIFKQEFIPDKYQVGIIVENVSPSSGIELKNGDIVVMVNGKEATSLSVLNKILKSSLNKHIFRVERRIKNILLNDDKLQNAESSGLRHRRNSGDKTDSDSSNPPSSSDSPAKRSLKGSPEHNTINRSSLTSEPELDFTRPQMQSSKDMPYSKIIAFNDTFKFQVLSEHRYLNLSLWSRGEEKNILLGHISIPIAPHCSPEIVGNRVYTFSLLPPNPNMANSWSEKLGGLNGFEPCLCYGDVLVSMCFSPLGSASSPPSVTTVTITPPTDSIPPTPEATVQSLISTHDFIRTHFTKVTQCDFCFKKIWLKDAFQCQGCQMTCHKKCAPKCQASQPCAKTKSQPEIVATSPENNSSPIHILQDGNDRLEGEGDIEEIENESKPTVESGNKGSPGESGTGHKGSVGDIGTFGSKGSIGALLASMAGGIKRTGSASTLTLPQHLEHSSTSLPPTPSHSPSPSRKASLVDGCLFGPIDCGIAEVDQAVELILSRPHDDNVMDIAKSSGKQLFSDLPPELRKKRIDQVMSRLKDAMDIESQIHRTLLKEEQNDENTLAQVIKSEERLQALTILMLHCCAGLQDSQENSNQPL